MANHRNRFPARRRFLKQSTALSATVALPHLARAAQPVQEGEAQGTTAGPQQPPPTQQLPTPSTQPVPQAPLRRTREPRR